MTEVWVVIEGRWDENIVSVHSTKEKAQAARDAHDPHAKDGCVIVLPYDVDPPTPSYEEEE